MLKKTNLNPNDEREIDLPTFIDIIFLLLIFFIATLSMSSGENERTPTPDSQRRFELPQASGRTSKSKSNVLSTLMFQIERKNGEDLTSPKVLYVLWPNKSAELTAEAALRKIRNGLNAVPPDSTNFAVFPDNFLDIKEPALSDSRPFRLIAENIARYQKEFLARSNPSNTIEVRATKETEFKVIGYILDQCSQYDDHIPKVTFRVMAPSEDEGGTSSGS